MATGFVGGHAGNYIEEALKPFGIKGVLLSCGCESRSCINIWDEVNHVQTEFLEPGFYFDRKKIFRDLREIQRTGKRC